LRPAFTANFLSVDPFVAVALVIVIVSIGIFDRLVGIVGFGWIVERPRNELFVFIAIPAPWSSPRPAPQQGAYREARLTTVCRQRNGRVTCASF
jgi:hypothetical protein